MPELAPVMTMTLLCMVQAHRVRRCTGERAWQQRPRRVCCAARGAMESGRPSRNESEEGQRRLAMLIDADNAQPAVIEGLLAEVAKYGIASVKRIYGDFTSTRMTQWKQALLKHSINPVQQFAYTSGKNATDSSLIIDAMDLLYTRRFDGFCLVSSDSDFTRLAQRLREEGLTVYGFGERKTPDAFVQACDKFIYTEVLRSPPSPPTPPTAASPKPSRRGAKKVSTPQEKTREPGSPNKPQGSGADDAAAAPLALIRQAIEQASDDQGWSFLSHIGNYLVKIRPDFDPRLYGHKKLKDLLKHYPEHIELEERSSKDGNDRRFYVRWRD
jgi:uncharacterized LabA/DUF88 family protein